MIVFHKSWCGACKALGPQIAANAEIGSLGSDLVMINVHDDEDPNDPKYSPDGGYIPRVLFTDPHGTVLTDLINEGGNPKYKYYYSDPASLVRAMKKAIQLTPEAPAHSDPTEGEEVEKASHEEEEVQKDEL